MAYVPTLVSRSGVAREHHPSGRSYHRRMMQYSAASENTEGEGSALLFTTVTVTLCHHPEFGSNNNLQSAANCSKS